MMAVTMMPHTDSDNDDDDDEEDDGGMNGKDKGLRWNAISFHSNYHLVNASWILLKGQ